MKQRLILVSTGVILALALAPLRGTLAQEGSDGGGSVRGSRLSNLVEREPRDPWLRPFSSLSIWNMPLGNRARIEDVGYLRPPVNGFSTDVELMFKELADHPQQPIYTPPGWRERCGGTNVQTNSFSETVQYYLRIPDARLNDTVTANATPNDVTTWLRPDGSTIFQLEPYARCEVGGPVYGYWHPTFPEQSIYGLGIYGTHFGSGLSGFGGSIRYGELTGQAPIKHALHLNLWGQLYLYYDAADRTPGYRWPADRQDACANATPSCYGGTNPKYEIGALLAIPPTVTAEQLGLRTQAGRQLFAALQNYGAYITDDSAWDNYGFGLSEDAYYEFEEVYGYPFNVSDASTGAAADFNADLEALIVNLGVVNDNRLTNVGGAGSRRAPLASPFFKPMDTTAPTAPSAVQALTTTVAGVDLAWTAATDNNRVMRYEVLSAGSVIGTTRGRTHIHVSGLEPDTAYTLTVRAVDTGLNTSSESAPLAVRTRPGYVENFNDGQAQGWTLGEGFGVTDDSLYIDGWGFGLSQAFYSAKRSSGSYSLSVDLFSYAGDPGNNTFVYFNRQDSNNTYGLQIGGGATAPNLTLFKLVNGARTTLGASTVNVSMRDNPTLVVVYDAVGGAIQIDAVVKGVRSTRIPAVADATFSAGSFGLGVSYCATRFDNVAFEGTLVDPPVPPVISSNFDDGSAPGWSLTNAVVAGGVLDVGVYAANSLALNDTVLSGDYTFTFDLTALANDNGNQQYALFNYTDGNNTYRLEIGGGTSNTLVLARVVGGSRTVLGAYAGSYPITGPGARFTVRLQAGAITVSGQAAGVTTPLFSVVDTTLTGGKIGFSDFYSRMLVDNVTVTQP
jgi:hypothetical protein